MHTEAFEIEESPADEIVWETHYSVWGGGHHVADCCSRVMAEVAVKRWYEKRFLAREAGEWEDPYTAMVATIVETLVPRPAKY